MPAVGRAAPGLCVGVLIAVIAAIAGCSSESDSVSDQRQTTVRSSVPWNLIRVKSPDALRIVSHVGYCVGDFEPMIAEVQVDESESTVVITVEAEVDRVPLRQRDVACLGAGKPLHYDVTLTQPLEERTVVDGGVDPPKQRWPSES